MDYVYGDELAGTYPLTASIAVDRYAAAFGAAKKNVLYALRNTLDFYTTLSPHYAYSSSFGDKTGQKLNILSIPSIFYGSNIEKGSVKLKYFVTGTLIAEASDTLRNGVLYQTSGSTTGSSVGVVLYNEGFIILTASAALRDDHSEAYDASASTYNPSWHYFGTTNAYAGAPSSFLLILMELRKFKHSLFSLMQKKISLISQTILLFFLSQQSLTKIVTFIIKIQKEKLKTFLQAAMKIIVLLSSP